MSELYTEYIDNRKAKRIERLKAELRDERQYNRSISMWLLVVSIALIIVSINYVSDYKTLTSVHAVESSTRFQESDLAVTDSIDITLINEAAYLSLLQTIDEDVWRGKNVDERLELVQLISNYECANNLGVPKVPIQYGVLDEGTLGQYTADVTGISGYITLDYDYLDGAAFKEVLGTVLHEVRHHYQKYAVDVLNSLENNEHPYAAMDIFRDAIAFRENKTDYKKPEIDGVESYSNQVIEVDARSFACDRIDEYYMVHLSFDPDLGILLPWDGSGITDGGGKESD